MDAQLEKEVAAQRELYYRFVAKLCHEANKLWCEFNGDNSQSDWVNAPEWQQESAVAGVKFHLENPGSAASASHEAWYKYKEADGWTYGPIKDPAKKEHPCMVKFEELPEFQQRKDMLFKGICTALLHEIN